MATLIILNPHAGGGRARRLWSTVEPLLWQALGDLVIAITDRPEEVAAHLDQAIERGLDRVVVVGGDGSNHVVVNRLADLALHQPELRLPAFGSLPIGTGRDWARTVGIPLNAPEAVTWLRGARPAPVDMGRLTYGEETVYFLNVASAGIGGEIDANVNAIQRRRPWTFLAQTIRALMDYAPKPIQVYLDGELWYEGTSFITAVANGRSFGHGMQIAPEASINDGLFDVVLAEEMGRLTAIQALPSLYSGTHLQREDIRHARATEVRIESPEGPLDLDLDGEYNIGQGLVFTMEPALLQMLQQPSPQLE